MDCPNCGYALKLSEKECPRCIYIANTVQEHKQRQHQQTSLPLATLYSTQQRTYCSACRNVLESGVRFCKDCGAPQQGVAPREVPLPSAQLTSRRSLPAPPEKVAVPNTTLISSMWTLTVVEMVLLGVLRLKQPTVYAIDLPAFVMAIVLAVSSNAINRGNGWVKLAVDGIGFAALAVVNLMR